MRTRRLLIRPPEHTPLWVQLYVRPVGTLWAAMILPEGATPPKPGHVKGAVFFGGTAEEAEWRAISFFGDDVALN
jgi:hypothetical protein